MGGFNNPVVGGGGDLVRERIRSPDYQAGVSGWTINQDGSAEFNELTARGALDVIGTDGSYVKAQATGGHADVLLNPQTVPGYTWNPAIMTADVDPAGTGTNIPAVTIRSPAAQGSTEPAAEIYMLGPGQLDQNAIALRTNSLVLEGNSLSGTVVSVRGPMFVGSPSTPQDLDVSGNLSLAPWTAFTPAWSSSLNPQPSLGNGTVDAAWRNCGSTGFFRITYVFGNSTNFGNGAWGFTLPFSPIVAQAASAIMVDDSATARVPGQAFLTTASGVFRVATPGGGTGASPTSPFTWAAGDILCITGSCEI